MKIVQFITPHYIKAIKRTFKKKKSRQVCLDSSFLSVYLKNVPNIIDKRMKDTTDCTILKAVITLIESQGY